MKCGLAVIFAPCASILQPTRSFTQPLGIRPAVAFALSIPPLTLDPTAKKMPMVLESSDPTSAICDTLLPPKRLLKTTSHPVANE
jgi:hypothetical protein